MPNPSSLASKPLPRIWALVTAAGSGRRMGGEIPKQYLALGGRTVLEHSLAALESLPELAGLVVGIAENDAYWPRLQPKLRCPLQVALGGVERADTVRRGLDLLSAQADTDDWILVHDAARPCLRAEDLAQLVRALCDDPVGGLLAVPVHDTMKQADDELRSAATLDRRRLWHALTPQMFRLGALHAALEAAQAAGVVVTDEASAMEHAGYRPRLIEGHADNIKVTRPDDLALAEFYLRRQGRL